MQVIFGKSVCRWLIICLVFSLLFYFFLQPPTKTTAEPSAQVTIGEKNGHVGDEVKVPVKIENAQDLAGGKVVVSYDPQVIEISEENGIIKGEVLEKANLIRNPDYSENSLAFVWAGTRPLEESGTLAELTFYLQKTGESSLQLEEIDLSDTEGRSISAEGKDGSLRVFERDEEVPDPDVDPEDDPVENGVEPDPEADPEVDEREDEVTDPDEEVEPAEPDVEIDLPEETLLRIEDARGALGETVPVAIVLATPEEIAGGMLVISYEPEMVEPLEFSNNLPEGYFMEYNLAYTEDSLSVAWFGIEESLTAEKVIANISFQLNEEGESLLEVKKLQLLDAEGDEVSVQTVDGTLICGDEGVQIFGINIIYLIIALVVIAILAFYLFWEFKKKKNKSRVLDKGGEPGEG